MIVRRMLLAGCALASLPLPAAAQLASPVATTQQSATPLARGAAAAQVAVPSPDVTAWQPTVIESTAPVAHDEKPDLPPRPVPATPPSEFESFVSAAAGTPLRRFGADLLVPGARDFAAGPTATVPPDYRLNPGDELLLGLTGSVQASSLRLKIDSEGRIFVPRIGAIMVAGVRYGDVQDVIARRVARQYRGFQLEVSVARLHGVTVYVTGFAAAPGSYTVGSLSTLVNAVLASGGPAAGGSFRSIQLRRGGKLVSDFDLYDLLLKGDRSGDAVLQNGDVIYIAPAGEQVAVIGSVNREAIFEVAPGETVNDAIRYAGGVNTVADASRLMVFDSLGRDGRGWDELSASEASIRKARRGDIVRVLSQVGIARPLAQQSVLVTISGEVARPGRYYFKPGTRLGDVVAQAGGLTAEAFPYASVITRESVKAQQQQSFERAVEDVELLLTAQPVTSANRAQLVQPANLALVRSIVDQLRERRPSGRLVFELPVTADALPGALVLENNDTIYVPPRPVTVGVFGAVPTPASFAWRDGATIGDFVRSAGGVQKLGDKSEIFVVRANGTVLADGKRVLRAPALPGDLIYVPIDANRGEFWARLRDITGSLFGGLVGAASINALVK
ncbi:protein involved in polysaccharide export with SLBB domain [Sphingomonas naasensis]|uniref:Capsule biosynthesis protein n=1 Tax=Sphingomonas naasensis TaxID=1344951 RepID=A0A4S1W9H0_9SPHN|nr:SLBB domain-containing protein [Sphingomonas naasensis]NIJ20023.1 protein involved in polysaccharide export with SLBB domain [Sphingomonas naasensis]TGX37967.1 capsule biosynthesis protein [Sphingomonas naasensis]